MLSQESGYSGGKPNQRGSYISIPKKAWFYFPTFKDKILNLDSEVLWKNQMIALGGEYILWSNTPENPFQN